MNLRSGETGATTNGLDRSFQPQSFDQRCGPDQHFRSVSSAPVAVPDMSVALGPQHRSNRATLALAVRLSDERQARKQ